MRVTVGVFFGGRSVEHEVSVISAIQAVNAFDKSKYDVVPVYCAKDDHLYAGTDIGKIEAYKDIPALLSRSQRVICAPLEKGRLALVKYPPKLLGGAVYASIDLAFPIVHGANVEDGTIQGFFNYMSVPFVGCDVTASAVSMDKYVTKAVLRFNDIPVLDCVRLSAKPFYSGEDEAVRRVENAFSYPMIVKPVNLGSSIGIKKAYSAVELVGAFEYAFQFAGTVIVERAVENLRELNCAVLGYGDSAEASECEEPISGDAILSYSDKYMSGGKSKGMSASKRKLPADLPPETRAKVRELAVRTFTALGCCGVSRIDMLMDAASGEIWVNEINPIPGSLSFYLWEPLGVSYARLIDKLIELSFTRERENAEFASSFDTNILENFSGGMKGPKQR
ncbi:D-alanine--D-alanine ligase [Synergistales bacterium]|nr:D-alanine--D-alanine ligase [Synergistales bacterium]